MNESACGNHSLLQSLAEGTLQGAELQDVRSHLSGCAVCRRTLTEYKQVMWDLAHPPEVPIPDEIERSYTALMLEWKKERLAQRATRSASRSLVPAWAGYSVLWTRRLPAVNSLGSLLHRAGSAMIGRSLPRWLRRRGGGRD